MKLMLLPQKAREEIPEEKVTITTVKCHRLLAMEIRVVVITKAIRIVGMTIITMRILRVQVTMMKFYLLKIVHDMPRLPVIQ
jgi:hypothetical protein